MELLAQFKGEFPPSLLRVMSGEAVAEGAGFHQIAMQVAVTANALGKTEEDMLSLAEGVVMNHQSDGSRYNSPAKRRNELSRMFRYTQDNVCYPYNRAAVKKLVPKDVAAPDLDGIPAAAGAMTAQGDNGNDDGLLGDITLPADTDRNNSTQEKRSKPMKFTVHAQKQAQRRAIDPELVNFIVGVGVETHAEDGCTFYRIPRAEMRFLKGECPVQLWKRYRDRMCTITALLSSDQEVITTMHRYRPLWRRWSHAPHA